MAKLPVIVGFGGVNAAGRSSFHHGYRRMIMDVLYGKAAEQTYHSLANLMNLKQGEAQGQVLDDELKRHIRDNTLVRRIGTDLFDVDAVAWNSRLNIAPTAPGGSVSFVTQAKQLPQPLPPGWQVSPVDAKTVKVEISQSADLLIPSARVSAVKSGGQLPTGFDPKALYAARSHPRGIQMTVFGASDALGSMGIGWDVVRAAVSPDQVSVYAGSGMSQLDVNGNGGMTMSRLTGKKVTSKQCPFGFAEMPADFINAYVLGSLGNTGTNMGACASFLYNLRQGISDIRSGQARVVMVGNAEAPITPEIIEGYAAMGALTTDAELLALDEALGLSDPDHQRACRPFSTNAGFTLAESAQFMVLMDDELALELGASIHGACSDVFVNADGFKKSIAAPGVGNYVTMAKATAAARAIVGEQSIKHRSFVEAHGTGTPQNRVTESHIMNETAKAFGIENWHVSAVKAYLGHSIGAAGADQLFAALGVWEYGWVPGIRTIDHIADDVHHSHLNIDHAHAEVGLDGMDVAIINAKGFGGNNASASVLAPHVVEKMLMKKHGRQALIAYHDKNRQVKERAEEYDRQMSEEPIKPIYKFDHNVLSGDDVQMAADRVSVAGFDQSIDLNMETPYTDML